MGRRIRLNDEPIEYSEDTTISQLKEDAGWPKEDTVVFSDPADGEAYTVHDQETVGDIPDGAPVSRQVTDGKFG